MKKFLIILSIIIITIILSTDYKHKLMTLIQVLYYHQASHEDNKIFPSVYMEGNQTIPEIERDLIKYDKTKIDFSKDSANSIMVLHKNKIVPE